MNSDQSAEPLSDPLTNHSYDGIQEFDNPLPGWWKWMFVASIVFSIFYAMYFHIGAPGRAVADQYDRALAANTALQYGTIGDLQPTNETIAEYLAKDSWVKVGQVVFKTNCVSCHGQKGEGKVGPNLADNVYKNVNDLEGIGRVINNGAANGAMPAWSTRLHPNDVVMVSAYVASLRDTNPDGGKAPDGKEIPPWPKPSEKELGEEAGGETESS